MINRILVAGLAVLVLGLLALSSPAGADGTWLDSDRPLQWNRPGMALPTIVAQDEVLLTGQRCSDNARPAETMEDFLVEQAGWYLIEGYDSGWGVRVVAGTSGFDGMCRYAGYQYFVFVDGVFAGTVSPELMSSRSDGGAGAAWVRGREFLLVDFVRYAPTDAFCCPSGQSFAHYTIDLTDAGPMLRFTGATTQRVSTHSIRQTHAGATRG